MEQAKKMWFKIKNYGWGWRPSSWQGWVVLGIYIIFNVKIFMSIDNLSHSNSDTLMNFSLPFFLSTVMFVIICYLTGEKPKWQWGRK
jgi:hypothetical protein